MLGAASTWTPHATTLIKRAGVKDRLYRREAYDRTVAMEALVSLNLNDFFFLDSAIAWFHDYNTSRTRWCRSGSLDVTFPLLGAL
jgi:hypothetical protein